ncbi:MAG: ATP-binding protein [Candidatus Latescibacterota bacterium]|nr:MAG: ATP-binding protein [Candidatus Latescibacterota bacterium]
MEKKYKRDFDELNSIYEATNRFLEEEKIGESVAWSINLAIEELFTNMVKYNTGAGHPILIRMSIKDGRLQIQMIDEDVDPFDPSEVPEIKLDEPIDERQIGGLGLHLVKSIVDKITYEYKNRQMKVTMIKELKR